MGYITRRNSSFKKMIPGAIVGCIAALLGACLGVAVLFYNHVPQDEVQVKQNNYEGIVVFTGGQGRVQKGFDALQTFSQAKRLLISGVNPTTSFKTLLNKTGKGEEAKKLSHSIELDYTSQTTFGNITQTKQWVKEHGFKRIVVVTSHYHAPRVRLLFNRYLPEVTFLLYPVISEDVPFWLWVAEFAKYIAIRVDFVLGGFFFG